MKNYIIIGVFLNICIIFGLYTNITNLKYKIYNKEKELKITEQTNDSLNFKLSKSVFLSDNNKKYINLLRNEIILNNTTIQVLKDSINIIHKIDNIKIINNDTLKSKQYLIIDSLQLDDSSCVKAVVELNIDSNLIATSNFKWKYNPKNININTGLIFNIDSKLLRSYALVNNIRVESKINMYEEFYNIIYDSIIKPNPIKPFKFYERISVGVGIAYLYNGDILPNINLSYSFTIREFLNFYK